ncbi:ribosomal large subunit pseudouridine synthase B [Marinitoga hydrogenitolerans DSM 16785]|uniref:Pseudouridine synthase n=1 Tax=Marinitoga hydrogenitolerans (strain DSM 16785 / JCM 12826 / AT1271) TaxID=1122195 RepID=A0A1M4XBY1_MARH1|nr:pseudouridine synthase [Marinitoga hydrogenitolerans]SHE91018.1 ribosomal large subunit pseudouridine synthase B [Marinitoga hydrogenitolerans DSM 16785]
MIKLQTFLQKIGEGSRREIGNLIVSGKIKVNGEIIREPWFKVVEEDIIEIHGKKIHVKDKISEAENYVYYLIHKPIGYLSALKDDRGRKTITDLIQGKIKEKVFHVGRLDYNTSGLMLLTNDGDLANLLLHPKKRIYKTYKALLNKHIKENNLKKLEEGIIIEGGYKTQPAKIEKAQKKGKYSEVTLSIHEGKKRQVRLMFKVLGFNVLKLKRIKFGPWSIKEVVNPGDIKKLNPEDIKKLKEYLKK